MSERALARLLRATARLLADPGHIGSQEVSWRTVEVMAQRFGELATGEFRERYLTSVVAVRDYARHAARHERRLHLGTSHPPDVPAERRARGMPFDANHLPLATRAALIQLIEDSKEAT